MEKGIKNIIFDLGGVLIDLDIDRCLREFKALGVSNVEELVNSTHTAGVFSALEHGKVSPAEFRDEIRRLAGNPELTDAQIDNAWLSILLEIPQKKLDLLLRLNRKYRVFLLSNTNEIQFFRQIVESKAVGNTRNFQEPFRPDCNFVRRGKSRPRIIPRRSY